MAEPRDTGDLLSVPKEEQKDHDDFVAEEVNEDEFADLSGVPDGEDVDLSTAHLDDLEDQ